MTSLGGPAIRGGDDGSHVREERDFRRLLAQETSRATRYQHFFSVCLVRADVEHGDEGGGIQRALAAKISEILRRTDVVGQVEGETAILLLHATDTDAIRVAERIRCTLGQVVFPPAAAGTSRRITVSMGEACFPDDGSSHAALLSRARAHLEEAKRRGGDQIVRRSSALP